MDRFVSTIETGDVRNRADKDATGMVCQSAVAALRATQQAERSLKPVLDEWYERLEREKRVLGIDAKK